MTTSCGSCSSCSRGRDGENTVVSSEQQRDRIVPPNACTQADMAQTFKIVFFLKVRWHYATHFNNHSHGTIIHSFILHHSPRPVFLYPHRFFAQQEKNLHGVPSRESNLGQPRNYQLSHAATIMHGHGRVASWTWFQKVDVTIRTNRG